MCEWINVSDRLPVIEKDRFSIQVIIAAHDPVYEEISPGKGTYVSTALYDGKHFLEYYDESEGFYPLSDEVIKWMPMPKV